MTLSVVLAAYNEEKNLRDCLESVQDLADEIVLVDGGSADKTIEIAKQYGAKIIKSNNPSIFHINKQKAIEAASKDWILQLDADERITPELSSEIDSKFQIPNSNINGYWLPRKNWFLGRFLMKGGQYPDYTLRLYRRGKGYLPCKTVHEQAVVEGQTEYLKNPLIHLADRKFGRYFLRWNRYIDLMVSELKEKKQSPFLILDYLLIQPTKWFFLTYFRHKGFMDSWQGFVFSLFSALRFPVAFIKYLRYHK